MKRVPAERWVILLNLQLFRLKLFVTRGRITRRRFAFLARFRTFNGNNFPRHTILFPLAFPLARRLRPRLLALRPPGPLGAGRGMRTRTLGARGACP